MQYSYAEYVPLFKALTDETRLKIIDMLSNGEMCACEILQSFNITQPTLSYHMKTLCDSGIVIGRREGAWMYYCLVDGRLDNACEFLSAIGHKGNASICECNKTEKCGCKEKGD